MPASLTVKLEPSRHTPTPRQMLGAAAALFESADSDHHADLKPFAAGPLTYAGAGPGATWADAAGAGAELGGARSTGAGGSVGGAGAARTGGGRADGGRGVDRARGGGPAAWRLGWLADEGLPPDWPPRTVRFGPDQRLVTGFGVELWPYARLAAGDPVRRARLTTSAPMFFSRSGRDLPLPEPVLIVRGLLTRWNAFSPPALRICDEDAQAVVGGVFLDAMTGRTESMTLTPKLRQVGFVGTFELRLLRDTSESAAGVFAALMRFAAIAGIGAQTTCGFGAVDVTLPTPPDPIPAAP